MSEDMGSLRASPVRQDTLPDAWQDISTAPRDGTRIDIWAHDERLGRPGSRYAHVGWGRYDEENNPWGPYHWRGAPASEGFTVTHWRPEPAPPTSNDTASAAANQETLNPKQLQTIDRGRVEP